MNSTSQESPLTGPITHEAERLGNDLSRFLAGVPVAQRGIAMARVLTKVFQGIPEPKLDAVPDELMVGFQDNFPGKQVIPKKLIDWALEGVNMEEVMAGIREIRETGGFSLDDFLPELEALAKSHE